jgi:hypothetical protein
MHKAIRRPAFHIRREGTSSAPPPKARPSLTVAIDRAGAVSDSGGRFARCILSEHGVKADVPMLSRFLRRRASASKKRLYAAERDRPDVARQRARWQRHQGRLDPRRPVYIYETWAKANMTRRAPLGSKRQAAHRQSAFRRMENPHLSGGIAPCPLFDGPINGRKFRAYVEEALVRTLKPDDIVIIDNLGSHKGHAIRAAIRKAARGSSPCHLTRQTSIPFK